MSGKNYRTLAGLCQLDREVRKSRFLAIGAPIDSVEQALAFFTSHHVSDASHNCWAYKIGEQYRFNDDGEPGATAGKPILQAIEGQGLDAVAVLVVRWFGGIKLGAGGLVRAYGGTAAECLRLAEKREVLAALAISLRCSYSEQGAIRLRLTSANATAVEQTLQADGICFSALVLLDQVDELRVSVNDITRGKSAWSQQAATPMKLSARA